MNIFQEMKERVTARQVAERYGLKVSRNGMARCPFHNDKHPSMKIDRKIYAIEKAIVKLEKDLKKVKKKWFHRKEQKELEGKIDAKNVQLEKAKAALDLLPAQYGYQNTLEVTKAMKLAKAELKKVQQAQKVWDAPEPEPEKMYLRIPANVQNVEKRVMQKSTGQKRSIHERLEEKKQIAEQQLKKKKQRNGMEL